MHRGADALARALVARFGDDSRPAAVLASGLQTTPHAVSSLAQFTSEAMSRLEPWTRDSDANVRRFAEGLMRDLRRSRDQFAAIEEHERRRLGT
jgi:hypothetical protein